MNINCTIFLCVDDLYQNVKQHKRECHVLILFEVKYYYLNIWEESQFFNLKVSGQNFLTSYDERF